MVAGLGGRRRGLQAGALAQVRGAQLLPAGQCGMAGGQGWAVQPQQAHRQVGGRLLRHGMGQALAQVGIGPLRIVGRQHQGELQRKRIGRQRRAHQRPALVVVVRQRPQQDVLDQLQRQRRVGHAQQPGQALLQAGRRGQRAGRIGQRIGAQAAAQRQARVVLQIGLLVAQRAAAG